MSKVTIIAHGATNSGLVREENEDTFLSAPELGLFIVLDGMGGHNAGDVASNTARDVIEEYVGHNIGSQSVGEILERAIQRASEAVFSAAQSRHELHGMGTTVVACLIVDSENAVVAHVGDSRAYLLRDGRLRLLTRDHTVVAELLSRNAISAEDALHHPYKSVLSRNLGGKPETIVDILNVPLEPGDRLLLCSDGLSGFASQDAIEHVLTGAEDAQIASSDLIDLALRGGGGDNVTALIIETGEAQVPQSTQILRTSGAAAWWQRREEFLEEARRRGVANSPICSVLSEAEAIEIVAGNLCEAIFHDLEQTTGIHVWTYTENLANGWFDQGGRYEVIRDLLDILRESSEVVIRGIAGEGESFAVALEVAVLRALIVAEMAIGGVIADRILAIEDELVRRDTTQNLEPPTLTGEKTMPFMDRRVEPPSPDVTACLEAATQRANTRLSSSKTHVHSLDCVALAHEAAVEAAWDADMLIVAKELYGTRAHAESSVTPLLDALEEARLIHLDAVNTQPVVEDVRAAALRRLATAHMGISSAVATLVLEAGQPITDVLRSVVDRTATMRAEVGRGELRISELERDYVKRYRGAGAKP